MKPIVKPGAAGLHTLHGAGRMRDAMPETAAFVDAMRDAFGAELVDEAIRAGMRGAPRFVAVEAGRTVGTVDTFGADDRTHVITEEQFQDMRSA